ncbi:unnamed protein product [Gongylonema pulchrum]|uniref:Transmembrane protein n=1 Tax=Gongylonema pulchrum TaxID=637853 RepID=A0A183DH23_9BILA|nr:unnamed protein product [Gongylonema pulchrum]
MVSIIRFVDILTKLDYRSIGEAASWAWRIHNTVEVTALGAHFAVIVLCLRIMEITNDSSIPHIPQPFMDFRNPLSVQPPASQQYSYTFQEA